MYYATTIIYALTLKNRNHPKKLEYQYFNVVYILIILYT